MNRRKVASSNERVGGSSSGSLRTSSSSVHSCQPCPLQPKPTLLTGPELLGGFYQVDDTEVILHGEHRRCVRINVCDARHRPMSRKRTEENTAKYRGPNRDRLRWARQIDYLGSQKWHFVLTQFICEVRVPVGGKEIWEGDEKLILGLHYFI